MRAIKLFLIFICLAFSSVIGVSYAADQLSNSIGEVSRDSEEIRQDLFGMVNGAEILLNSFGMLPIYQDRIDFARDEISLATKAELESIPPDLYQKLRMNSLSAAQMVIAIESNTQSQKASAFGSKQSLENSSLTVLETLVNLDETLPNYPDRDWFLEFNWGFITEFVVEVTFCVSHPLICTIASAFGFIDLDLGFGEWEDAGNSELGHCDYMGNDYATRVTTLNLALTSEGVKDVAEQLCNQDILGVNLSVVCIVTDVFYILGKTVNEHEELCNDTLTAAEVQAIWEGTKSIHANISTHDEDMKALMGQVIELLNTPGGRRPDWPPPGPAGVEGESYD